MTADWPLEGFAKVYILTLSHYVDYILSFAPKDSSNALGFDGPSSRTVYVRV